MNVRRAIARPFANGGVLARRWTLALCAIALALLPNRSDAIDPARSLTQCRHRIWQAQQGLAQSTIYTLLQTQDGYLWLGTPTGLIRFDGVRFLPMPHEAGLSLTDLLVRDLKEDSEQALWVATDGGGVFRLRDGEARRYTTAEGLPSNHAQCLLADEGGVWVGTTKGLARISGENVTVLTTKEGLAAEDVRAMAKSEDGTLWVGGQGSTLSAYRKGRFDQHELASIPSHAYVSALLCSDDGSLWIGTNSGLVQLANGHERLYSLEDGLADDWVLSLAEGRGPCVWVGTRSGFSRLVRDRIESFRTRDGLSQSTAYAVCEDREGSVWVGTKHGLNQFLDRRTIPFTMSEGLPSNDVGPVLQDRSGMIWIGTLGAGLGLYDGRGFSVLTSSDGLASNTIRALANGAERELWVGTDRGLQRVFDRRVDPSFAVKQGSSVQTSAPVRSLWRDQEGALWVGSSEGLTVLRDGILTTIQGEDGKPLHGTVLAIGEHRDTIHFSTEGGALYQMEDGVARRFPQGEAPPHDIDAFYEDPDGRLWMGTRGGGLCILDGEKATSYSIQEGLFDDEIYGIAAGEADRVWMACSKGIFSVNRSDVRRFDAGELSELPSTPFRATDIQRTIECQPGVQPAVWPMSDGQIWFATIRGLIVIDPERITREHEPPNVLVERVIVNGKSERPELLGRLSPGPTNLSFRYTALSLLSPTRIRFRHKLEGFDKEWVDAGSRREAFYTNLPPGRYRFVVEATTIDGAVSETTNPVTFELPPSIYQRVWFLPLCGTLIALLGWGAYRLRVRRIKERLYAVVAERSRIARELHDTLMQGFSGITMEMQALAARLPPSPERETLHEIIGDAGTCLREARRSIGGLRSGAGDESGLAVAIAQSVRQLAETKDIRLNLRLDQKVSRLRSEAEYNLLRIAQEAVANAVKHSGARSIDVELTQTNGNVRLRVRDDGSGFAFDEADLSQTGHFGLLGMRERSGQLGADFHLESAPGRGTMVEVAVPIPLASPALLAVGDKP